MIVLVEDDLSIQKLVSYALEMNGFKVAVYSNGEDALASDNSSTELFRFDILLPGPSGLEMLDRILNDKTLN